jgi:hypothetical protein
MNEILYTPGVCNIGPAEIAQRKKIGWIGVVITVVLSIVLLTTSLPAIIRIVVFLPAFVGAIGLLQAYAHFCVAFGQAGIFNLGPVGITQSVIDATAKQQDQKRARLLITYAVLIALAVTVLVYVV